MKHAIDRRIQILAVCLLAGVQGCALLLPERAQKPVIRNPFPQLSRVAVAPFFNHSDEPTVDGREFALAYYGELQATPGFEVAPLGVVEEAILRHRIDLNQPAEARRLARLLGVDAVVVGAVTDFRPYYPPRCGMRVEWYTANEGYHQIPAGYGLPWNTPEEEFIPDALVYESQLAMARVEMAGQAPACDQQVQPLPAPPGGALPGEPTPAEASPRQQPQAYAEPQRVRQTAATAEVAPGDDPFEHFSLAQAAPPDLAEPLPAPIPGGEESAGGDDSLPDDASPTPQTPASANPIATGNLPGTDFPEATFLPESSSASACNLPGEHAAGRPPCVPYHGPVLSHTQIYRGNDPDVTEALRGYEFFQDDARFGGWEGYLQRSDDFIRFCCHLHISEMLSARGGSRETSVLWRWPENR